MPNFANLESIQFGAVRVTYLPDGGGIAGPVATFPTSTAKAWQAFQDSLDEHGQFITSIGGTLIETGARKILVDLGIGPNRFEFPGFGVYAGGKFLESLAEVGVEPADITDVVFTHLHLDHCGWTTHETNGRRRLTFPNARHLVTHEEWDFWHGGDNPAGPHPDFVQAPLESKLTFIRSGDEIAPGLRVIGTPGHTPGHISLQLESGDESLYLVGDIVYGRMQLQQPDWNAAFDTDPAMAAAARNMLLSRLVAPRTLVLANHFSDTVFGRVRRAGDAFAWTPLN